MELLQQDFAVNHGMIQNRYT